jgi:RNA polymerase sigma-70 factor, ECF subfamily
MELVAGGADEAAVIAHARRGDTNAFGRLVQCYQSSVYNLAFRMLGDGSEAEDAAQETFLRAYRQLGSYQPARKFATWLLSIAAHYCIDQLRRARAGGPSLDDAAWHDTLMSAAPEPEAIILERERSLDVQALLQTLPASYRAVLALRYWSDLSIAEIAGITGDSEGAVKVKLFRARQVLAHSLTQDTVLP